MKTICACVTTFLFSLGLWACGHPAPASGEFLSGQPITAGTEKEASSYPLDAEMGEPETKDDNTIILPEEDQVQSLLSFLKTATLPLGNTMYVWGGGWNEEDTGAGPEATTLGVSPRWKSFADGQNSDYDHRKFRYQIHDGLDCSGYVGWIAYNTFETENGREGYVFKSTDVAEAFASLGFGDYLPAGKIRDWKPGDIASMNGHVWISLGTCEDGSVLLIHSSPPGVRLSGTAAPSGESDALRLAKELMQAHFPDWYARFPDCEVSGDYLTSAGQLRWNLETFPDSEEIRKTSPRELMCLLFPAEN